jgi:hypothetical protein
MRSEKLKCVVRTQNVQSARMGQSRHGQLSSFVQWVSRMYDCHGSWAALATPLGVI